jgi:hypothetical protein
MNKVPSYIISDAGNINFIIDGTPHAVGVDHTNYAEIIDKLKNEDYEGIEDLLDVSSTIAVASQGQITVIDGCVCYNGTEIINPLTERILEFVKRDLPFKPMIAFLENLMENPSKTSVEELYLFMESNTLPITADGHFLAYKKVDNEYKSIHPNPDGTYEDHSIGAKPEMPRNQVDDERDRTCSTGYHFCSLAYLPHFGCGGADKVVILKINPKDVVSIPSDYDNAKGRACTYEVIGEHTAENRDKTEAFNAPVYNSDGSDYTPEDTCPECDNYTDECTCDECPECGNHYDWCECDNGDEKTTGVFGSGATLGTKPSGQGFHNVRDSKGRFAKK